MQRKLFDVYAMNLRMSVLVIAFLISLINLQAQTLSPKRGISGDMLDNNDCIAVDNYLTWYYNWANTPNASVISTHQNYIEYCPMLWNGTWNSAAMTAYLSAHPEVDYLLTFNEPNLTGQANMTPAAAAALWPQVEAIANTYNLKIVSPAMTYCASGCLAGYSGGVSSGINWLNDFFAACPGCRVDYIGLHVYDNNYWGFRAGNVGDNITGYKKYGRPIWITEFDYNGGTTTAQHASLMVDVIDYMEEDPDIFRYAWFLTRSSPSAGSTDILGQTTGTIADLGLVYTNMSSYDKNYYHNVNTTIQAEHYIDKSIYYCGWNGSTCTWPYSVLLEKTTDVSGALHAYNFNSAVEDSIVYNVDIPTTQTYTIDYRVATSASTTIYVKNSTTGATLNTLTFASTGGAWATRTSSSFTLPAGKQKIRITTNGSGMKLNWLRINCASGCTYLPVELVSFDALKLSDSAAELSWSTATEKNNKGFIVERSIDGTHFDSTGFVPGSISSSDILHYSYTDTDVSGSMLYYRLKQIDVDGNYFYSPVKVLSFMNDYVLLNGNKIVSHLDHEAEISYAVYNMLGQVMEQGMYTAKAGFGEKTISLNGLAKGFYLVKAISNNLHFAGKILNE
jgi:hypothetical protein